MRYAADEASEKSNALVNEWLLKRYRDPDWRNDRPLHHLVECPEAKVLHAEMEDGVYGCDTGCEMVYSKFEVACPHGISDEAEYQEFDELRDMLNSIGVTEDL